MYRIVYMYASIPPVAEKMSCLLPQFKCLPDSFSIQFKTHNHHSPQLPKYREPTFFSTRCILSATAPPTSAESTVLNLEKLQLSSLEVPLNSGAADRQWSSSASSTTAGVLDTGNFQLPSLESHTSSIARSRPWDYAGVVGPSMEGDFGATLSSEFVTSEDAVIAATAAAAAEAVALANAALQVAKSAAVMMANHQSTRALDIKPTPNLSESHNSTNGTGLQTSDEVEPTIEELELLEAQLSASIAVRSRRQVERRARRTRAAERAGACAVPVKSGFMSRRQAGESIVSVKSGSTSRRRAMHDRKDVLGFLGGMTNTKLLTAEEEVELSKGIQDLLKLERLQKELAKRFGVPPTFAEWAAAAEVDQKTLARRLHHGTTCRDKMVRSNIRLVISIAKSYYGTAPNLQDIVQEGCQGLVKGAEKFDASKGFKFSTYAHWWIRQAVRRSRAEQCRIIHVPFYMVEVMSKVNEARRKLRQSGIEPNHENVSKATGISVKRIQAAELAPKPPGSLDEKVGIDEDLKLSDITCNPDEETPEEILIKQNMKQDIESVLKTLNMKEQQVVRWRFGLEDGQIRTLQEIGDVMGVSRERVRQVELSAFRKLRSKNRTQDLRRYLTKPESW